MRERASLNKQFCDPRWPPGVDPRRSIARAESALGVEPGRAARFSAIVTPCIGALRAADAPQMLAAAFVGFLLATRYR